MARIKIDYGIDLGTTNSAIARIENGEPIIKKTDTLKDTMASCVGFNKKRSILAGDAAMNMSKSDKLRSMKGDNLSSNVFIEFKRTMGTDKVYPSSYMKTDYLSEDLSAEILKKLKSFITDEVLSSIVITVPAKFTINQKDATSRAAKLAGFKHCELLQEPIAASMAYGLNSVSKDGFWLVFDFGGGTFDAALLKVEEGIMQVVDTEGDNYLGGKNLDYAIVDEIILKYLNDNFSINSILQDNNKKQILQDAMKYYAEETKIQLSFNEEHNVLSDLGDIPGEDDEGEEFELDITVTNSDMERVLGPIFQKAIDIALDLLKRNHLSGSDLDSLILVGGPTYSPVLRKMLEEQICKPDTSIDPMTSVAKGAALYASTIDVSDEIKEASRDQSKIQLSLGYESTTVEPEEFITVKTLPNKTKGEIPEKVLVEIIRGDKAWSSGKVEIDEMGEVIDVNLVEGKPNVFLITLFDEQGNILPSEPNEFTIIQGTKVGNATLPYNVGVAIMSSSRNRLITSCISGLAKNSSYPVIGVKNGLKTQKQIRPGMKEDYILIAIYEMDYNAEDSRPLYNEHVFDARITGEDLPALLPEGSDVDITVKFLGEGKISLSAYFPFLEHTQDVDYDGSEGIQKEVDADWLSSELYKAKQSVSIIESEGAYPDQSELVKIQQELDELTKRFEQARTDYDRKKDVLESLKRSFRRIDEIQDATEWPKTEEELKDVYFRLEETNNEFGNDKTNENVAQFKQQIPEVINEKDVKIANQMIDDMRALNFHLIDEGMGAHMEIHLLYGFHENFDTHDWGDRNKARLILNQGLQLAATNPSKQQLRPIVVALYELLPEPEKPIMLEDKTVLSD